MWFGTDHVYVQEGVFFSKMAVVTFGGAYAVLAYMAQQAVDTYGWLAPGEMLDGLGLAETTPGPLIMVVQFVGFLGAYRNPGMLDPLLAGTLGALLTTWVTFVPCFLWIFLGAPYIERLRGNRALSAALSAITAAVVGVILNLAIWFALHVIFGSVDEVHAFGATLHVPDFTTLNPGALVLTVAALVAMLRYKIGMGPTLAVSALLGTAYELLL
jgi:chromate transporter